MRQLQPMLYYLRERLTIIFHSSSSQLASSIASCVIEEVNFKLASSMDLKDIRMAMGIKDAFSEKADFSLMPKEKVFIDTILQKTHMSVDEEGTVAAVVTAVVMKLSQCITEKGLFNGSEKPFLFIVKCSRIYDNYLFIAKVGKV